MRLRERLWNPYVLVFLSSACVMIIELVASRLIAPTVGVSLYTWTSVIGVILAGISLGNYIGGRLADRYASMGLLGILYTLASLTTLLALWLNNNLRTFRFPVEVPMMVWIVTYITVVFFLPGVILGCVAPVVVKLSLKDLSFAGTTVGKIYAWSAAGSIFGTFLTGFYLISRFGTRATMLGVAGVLMLLGIWFLFDLSWRRSLARVALVLILFGGGIYGLFRGGLIESECMSETNYFCINVKETERDGRVVHELLLDRLVHSYTDLEDPLYLGYGYEKTYAALVEPIAQQKPELAAFFIGGGGYTFPRYMHEILPDSHLVVSEIDEGVTEAAHRWLGLGRDTDIVTYNLDSRAYFLWEAEPDSFDLIFGDAFNDYSIPYHLTTLEFVTMIDQALREDGIYMANVIDGGLYGHFLRAFVATQQEVFEHIAVIPSSTGWRQSTRSTFVVAGSHHPIDVSAMPAEFPVLSEKELAEYIDEEPYFVLTDDYVPVDRLMVPVAEASFFGTSPNENIAQQFSEHSIVIAMAGLGLVVLGTAGWLILRKRAGRVDSEYPQS